MINKTVYNGFKTIENLNSISSNVGINTVIGPNGRGKSNLIDGISFAFEEQNSLSSFGGKIFNEKGE